MESRNSQSAHPPAQKLITAASLALLVASALVGLGTSSASASAVITYVDSGAVGRDGAPSTRWSVALPGDTAPGEVFLIVLTVEQSKAHSFTSVPAGTAQVLAPDGAGTASISTSIHTWVAPATPPSNITFVLASAAEGSAAWMRFRGVDGSNPLASGVGWSDYATFSTSATAPSVSATVPGAYVAGGLGIPSGTRSVAAPTGWTGKVTAPDRIGYLAVKGAQSTTGSTGSAKFTFSGTSLRGGAWQVALRPAPTAPEPTPTPEPTPVPEPTPTPEPSPTSSTRPGPDSTGVPAGVSLKQVSGMTVTVPGTVLDALDISGSVTVKASGVVIKNCRIRGTGFWGVRVESGDAVIQDSEISGFANAITGSRWTARRVEIFGTTQDGVKLGSYSTLEDSWIHDLTPEPGAHADGAQAESGVKSVVVRNNVIDVYNRTTGTLGNSAIIIKPDLGSTSPGPVTIENNYLNGGNYTLFVVPGSTGNTITTVNVWRNVFGPNHRYGYASIKMPVQDEGNTTATGAPLSL
jgi:hypothetical protein